MTTTTKARGGRSAGEPVVLTKGQIWECIASSGESNGTFELNHLEEHTTYGAQARLRNLETEGIAQISQRWLREGESRKPHPHWRLAD